jgi:hypothetical protein
MSKTNLKFELVLTGGTSRRLYVAFVPDEEGGHLAEQIFEWRTDSVALHLDLGALAGSATSGEPPKGDLHIRFGRQLYDTVFAGEVGELWRARRKAARREPLRLVVRVDQESARQLVNLPWEYLHDDKGFLALDYRTPISRLPWGMVPGTVSWRWSTNLARSPLERGCSRESKS